MNIFFLKDNNNILLFIDYINFLIYLCKTNNIKNNFFLVDNNYKKLNIKNNNNNIFIPLHDFYKKRILFTDLIKHFNLKNNFFITCYEKKEKLT